MPATLILTDLLGQDGLIYGAELRHETSPGVSYVCTDVIFDEGYDRRVAAWCDAARERGEKVIDRRSPREPFPADMLDRAARNGSGLVCRVMARRENAPPGVVCHYTDPDAATSRARAAAMAQQYKGWVEEQAVELIQLHDGPAVQHLAPGVDPVSHAARQIAQERNRRASRRGYAPPPTGGLFDDVARAQQELFA